MPLPSSGAISLNQMHIEVGGTSGTQCSLNDSDIRGLIGKASGAASSFSQFYGASGWTAYNPVITTGYSSYKTTFWNGYSTLFGIGSASSTAVPFKNNGNATLHDLYVQYSNSVYYFYLNISNCGTDTSNSGWGSFTLNSNTYYRSNFTFSTVTNNNNTCQWEVSLNYNPFGTTSSVQRTVVFSP